MKQNSSSLFKISLCAVAWVLCTVASGDAFASSCCGGGVAVPSLITGDDQAQVSAELTYSQTRFDVSANGIWRPLDTQESATSTRLSAAYAFKERGQVGLSTLVAQRARSGESDTGLGDTQVVLGYDVVTDWDYDPVLPKVIGFFSVTAPTGHAPFESERAFNLDAHGRGFWSLGIGSVATKSIRNFDLFASFEFHRSLAREYDGSVISPGNGGALGFGATYRLPSQFAVLGPGTRIGALVSTTFEDAVQFTGRIESSGALSRATSFGLSLGREFQDPIDPSGPPLGLTATYTDQSLLAVFGAPSNASLARSLSIALVRHWAR